MANGEVYEKNMTVSESVNTGDKIRVIMSDGSSKNVDFGTLAKSALENYDGSSLAGANQSAKGALDGLKSRMDGFDQANRNLVFGAKWDRTTNLMTRTNAAEGITTDTTNFRHAGSLNANYNNPFDSIYPWSELRVVNVDLAMYRSGNYTLRQCIVAAVGDPDFTWEGSANLFVGRYRPEFWYRSFEDVSGNVTFQVSQCERAGFVHAEEAVDGIGLAIDAGLNSSNQNIITAGAGLPLTNVACSTIHTRAKNNGFTLRSIYDISAINALYLVEYANMNSQAALGDGCSSQYRENSGDTIASVSVGTNTTLIEVQNTSIASYLQKGAQIDIGATAGATTYRGIIKNFELNSGQNGYKITLDRALSGVTTGMIISFHGFASCEWPYIGTNLGSQSGYIGTNGKANVYYRGSVFFANRYEYVLGIYRQTSSNKIFICPETLDPDDYDAINTSDHKDTGIVLPTLDSGAWLTVGGNAKVLPGAPGFIVTQASSGSSSSPVGDQQYVPTPSTGSTVLFWGGSAYDGWSCGCFCGRWRNDAGYSYWLCAGAPILKNPQ